MHLPSRVNEFVSLYKPIYIYKHVFASVYKCFCLLVQMSVNYMSLILICTCTCHVPSLSLSLPSSFYIISFVILSLPPSLSPSLPLSLPPSLLGMATCSSILVLVFWKHERQIYHISTSVYLFLQKWQAYLDLSLPPSLPPSFLLTLSLSFPPILPVTEVDLPEDLKTLEHVTLTVCTHTLEPAAFSFKALSLSPSLPLPETTMYMYIHVPVHLY